MIHHALVLPFLLHPVAALSQAVPRGSEVTGFAGNVVLHVLFHEAAHALIREFDLPVLANEESMADSFATTWITELHRDDAPAIVLDRVRSWLYEDADADPSEYDFKGEHSLDIRRAYQAACLLYGADPAEWGDAVAWLEFSTDDLADCSDTAPDQIDAWASVLKPHLRSDGAPSENVQVIYGEGPMKDSMQASGLLERVADDLRMFDWPEPIILHFDHCDQGAFWSRTSRTILLCDDYVLRFVNQGRELQGSPTDD